MGLAWKLAIKGLYTTDPNPRVGCVIVKDGVLLGSGWHERAGQPHAEIRALEDAGPDARGADVFVTLEPCAHHGRTGPCCEALSEAGVARVYVGSLDTNPEVAGRGLAHLEAAGISTEIIDSDPCRLLNPGFTRRMAGGLPWVRMKSGASLDGRTALANGQSQWITGAKSREDVQHLRARSSVLITGVGTVLADDPLLNVRSAEVRKLSADEIRQPGLVILDRSLRTPPKARLFQPDRSVLICCCPSSDTAFAKRARTLKEHAELYYFDSRDAGEQLREMLLELGRRGCNEVMVEAGAALSGSFLAEGLVDEYWLYISGKCLGHKGRALVELPDYQALEEVPSLHLEAMQRIDSDVRLIFAQRQGDVGQPLTLQQHDHLIG